MRIRNGLRESNRARRTVPMTSTLRNVNSDYHQQYLLGLLTEIVERSQPDGFADNSWAGLGRASICYCESGRGLVAAEMRMTSVGMRPVCWSMFRISGSPKFCFALGSHTNTRAVDTGWNRSR
ncbi:MAG: hypothetical protein ACJ74Y_03295 [Bryobacteraceae bacterium]